MLLSHDLSELPQIIEEKLRQVTLVLLPIGVVLMFLSWYQNTQVKNHSYTDHFGLPFLVVTFTLIWALALRRHLSGRQATVSFTLALCLFLSAEQLELALVGSLYQYGDPGSFGWMFVMYMLLFLSLDSHQARWVSFCFLALNATIYFSGLVRFRATPEVHTSYTNHCAASFIGVCILGLYSELKQQLGKAQTLAATDALTGLINRRQMQLHLEEVVAKERGFVLLLLDIDHFKQVNDQHGHNTGDTVLRELSKHIHHCLGTGNLLGRWGGEEFLVLLPDASHRDVLQLAETLLQHTRQQIFAKKLTLTLSIGGAQYISGERPEDVVHRADMALYRAKQTGRNRFHFHEKSSLTDAA
jgi:diguanylate cyclase (GGDEF)-like protein